MAKPRQKPYSRDKAALKTYSPCRLKTGAQGIFIGAAAQMMKDFLLGMFVGAALAVIVLALEYFGL